MTAEGHWNFAATDTGTRVDLSMEMSTTNWLFKLMAPMMKGKMKQQMADTATSMKRAAEAEIPA